MKFVSFINSLFDKLNNSRLIKLFNYLLSIVSTFYVANFFIKNNISIDFNVKTLIYSPILWIAYLLFSLSWSINMSQTKNRNYVIIWFSSLIGKYIPFKVGIPLFRLSESKKYFDKFDAKENIRTLLLEQLFLVFWGFYFGTLFFLNVLDTSLTFLIIFLLIGLLLNLLLSYFIKFLFKYIKVNNYIILGQFFVFLYMYFVFRSEFGYFSVKNIAAYFIVSSVSVLFIGPPAGFGIREYLYIQFLDFENLPPEIVNFAIIIRVLYLINEVFLSLLSKILSNLYK